MENTPEQVWNADGKTELTSKTGVTSVVENSLIGRMMCTVQDQKISASLWPNPALSSNLPNYSTGNQNHTTISPKSNSYLTCQKDWKMRSPKLGKNTARVKTKKPSPSAQDCVWFGWLARAKRSWIRNTWARYTWPPWMDSQGNIFPMSTKTIISALWYLSNFVT